MKRGKTDDEKKDTVEGPGRESHGSIEFSGKQTPKKRGVRIILVGVCSGVVVFLLTSLVFLAGFFIGRDVSPSASGYVPFKKTQTSGESARGNLARNARERIRNLIASGEVEVVRGEVSHVEDGKVSVDTVEGEKEFEITGSTRFLGGKGAGGRNELKSGDRVGVLLRKGKEGKLEAVAIKVKTSNSFGNK